jgi:hypothetical protein
MTNDECSPRGDYQLSAAELMVKYCIGSIGHPVYTRDDWKEAVYAGLTVPGYHGYWDWVASMLDQERNEILSRR